MAAASTSTSASNYLLALALNGDGVIDVVVCELLLAAILSSRWDPFPQLRPWLLFLSPAAVVIMWSPVMRETPTQP